MIVVDANIWVDHLRTADHQLARLLVRRRALIHPYTIGEIALGSIPSRSAYLENLSRLPQPPLATHEEVMRLIETDRLWASGIGYVDCHLLASARLIEGGRLWTRDKRLHAQAERLGLAHTP